MKFVNKRMYTIFTTLILTCVITIPIAANEGSANVNVSYTPGRAYAKVQLKLEVIGKGVVYDEDIAIQEGVLLYDMQEEDTKVLRVVPQYGYEISKVEFDDGYQVVDMINVMKEDKILVKLKDKSATLTIRFKEKKQKTVTPEKKPETNQTNMNKGTPQTADVTSRGRITSSLIVAGFILVLLTYKRKRIQKNEK